jgi:chorismate mutase/prephenate dehydratase
MDYKQRLEKVREQIDAIDNQLLNLFGQRMHLADDVADIKRQGNLALTDEVREQKVVENAVKKTDSEFKGATIAFIRTLIGLSKMRQRKILLDQTAEEELLPPSHIPITEDAKIAYQGHPGAWGEQATIQVMPSAHREPLDRFEDVFIAVKNGKFDYGVVPIENSRTGAIGEVYDLLREYGCYIVGQTHVQVKQCLIAMPGTKLNEIREVFSHPEGFRQCDRFLKTHDWDLTACRNTAVAAHMVNEKHDPRYAAIGSRRAAEINGLDIIVPDIIDDKENQTRFIVIAAKPEYHAESNIISVIFRTAHRSGALCDVLIPFMAHEINLSRIESRPMSGGRYCFFTDLEGNITDENVASAIRNAASVCGYMEVLGCYAEADIK